MTPVVGPDGDAFLEGDFSDFDVPACLHCGGILKPDVVYFGDNVLITLPAIVYKPRLLKPLIA